MTIDWNKADFTKEQIEEIVKNHQNKNVVYVELQKDNSVKVEQYSSANIKQVSDICGMFKDMEKLHNTKPTKIVWKAPYFSQEIVNEIKKFCDKTKNVIILDGKFTNPSKTTALICEKCNSVLFWVRPEHSKQKVPKTCPACGGITHQNIPEKLKENVSKMSNNFSKYDSEIDISMRMH